MGRGIQEIRDMCKSYGNPTPDFKVDADAVFVTFYSLAEIGGTDKNVAQKKSIESRIVELIKNNNKISREKIAKEFGVSKKTIERQLAKMRDKLQFVGRGYSGHWEITQ